MQAKHIALSANMPSELKKNIDSNGSILTIIYQLSVMSVVNVCFFSQSSSFIALIGNASTTTYYHIVC